MYASNPHISIVRRPIMQDDNIHYRKISDIIKRQPRLRVVFTCASSYNGVGGVNSHFENMYFWAFRGIFPI